MAHFHQYKNKFYFISIELMLESETISNVIMVLGSIVIYKLC